MTGLFAAGLILMLVVGGKTGQAQNNSLGIPIPQMKPSSKMSAADHGVIVVADVPLPQVKPKDARDQLLVMASLTDTEITKPALKPSRHAGLNKPYSSALPIRFFSSNSSFVLKGKQQELYQEIFALQRQGNFKQADKRIRKLNNDILVGYLLADRYLTKNNYNSSFSELTTWLKKYSDHPQARSVYNLMLAKRADQAVTVSKPKRRSFSTGTLGTYSSTEKHYKSATKRSNDQQKAYENLNFKIHRHVKNYEPTKALHLLSNSDVKKYMDDVEYDRMRSAIASGYLYAGKNDKALELAKASWKRSGHFSPLSGWVYGLTLWQKKNFSKAAQAFESTASSPYASGWMVSASSFWAARAFAQAGDKANQKKWLTLSASYPRTFYGIIASQALGKKIDYNWHVPDLDKKAIAQIEKSAAGKRALALIDVGLRYEAEKELLKFDANLSADQQQALIALASDYKMPALLMRLGSLYSKAGHPYDAALYPWAPWEPKGGFRVDKALIHAIVRQESRFDASASNPSGATGLMQLMPRTANYIAGHDRFKTAEGRAQLKQPHVNLSLGQDYIAHLLKHNSVSGDLLSLALAYNAGPGNLSRWKRERTHIQDPLLFIETIPYAETRAFVERVLSNYWIYRKKGGNPTPSLKAVANGNWAMYAGEILPKTTTFAAR